jgi:hypothetical protein
VKGRRDVGLFKDFVGLQTSQTVLAFGLKFVHSSSPDLSFSDSNIYV